MTINEMIDKKLFVQLPTKFSEKVTAIYEGYKHFNRDTKKWNCEIIVHTASGITIYPNMKYLLDSIK